MLAEQEFVAHLFAPLNGPHAAAALAQVRSLWDACRSRLAMTQPIPATGLSDVLPGDPAAGPEGALAGLQHPAAGSQAIARREHDVLNVSIALTGTDWARYAECWRTATAGGTGALLGEVTIFQAKTAADVPAVDLRAALPADSQDADAWWARRRELDGFAFWEVTPRGHGRLRRLVLLAGADEDERLSRFGWSDGGTGLPPFGRYLLHAAKLRYLGRVRGDGRDLSRVREKTAATLDRLAELLPQRVAAPQVAALAAELAADAAVVDATVEELRRMGRSAAIARTNMGFALAPPLPSDEATGEWLAQQLVADTDYLEAVRDRADRTAARIAAVLAQPAGAPVFAEQANGRAEHRIGFGVDVISYSSRSTPAQFLLQERVAAMAERILAAIGARRFDRQPAGDGVIVVLAPGRAAHDVLPGLLHGWRDELAADNAAHPQDRIRLRLSVGAGPFTNAALGFSGRTVIEVGRLLDSAELRTAAADRPAVDVVALVSGRLYDDVVGEGYPGLEPGEFTGLAVSVKELRTSAWLWTGAP